MGFPRGFSAVLCCEPVYQRFSTKGSDFELIGPTVSLSRRYEPPVANERWPVIAIERGPPMRNPRPSSRAQRRQSSAPREESRRKDCFYGSAPLLRAPRYNPVNPAFTESIE